MYATAIVRKKGQVVIPEAVRSALKIIEGDLLILNIEKVAGDYLLKGVKDELYPVRKDIFEETYEVVKDGVKTEGLMKCCHPYSKCRFMIGLAKKYKKPVAERKCGVAEPDTVCKPIKDAHVSV